ncbi:MAG: lytic transglycosylase domain-containing protein [Burkholderiaceae bacterium]|nr:lytic transglycosylase domain-containing protein [Burkholderiaceae bacterium]
MIVAALAAALCMAQPAMAKKAASPGMSDDDAFLALRDAARAGDEDKADKLADRLQSYDLPSYVDYYRLKARLADATPEEMKAFLALYDGTAIADRMRNDWLLALGYTADWKNFDEQYPQFIVNDDRQVKCYALLSRELKGENVTAEARSLFTAPKEYGDGCATLIRTLYQAGQFSMDELQAQIRLAAETAPSVVVQRLVDIGDLSDTAYASALEHASNVIARGPAVPGHAVFLVALGRAAKADPAFAAAALTRYASSLTKDEQATGWAQIAYEASFKLSPDAIEYWRRAGNAPLSYAEYPWRVRMALRAGDWKMVESGILAMPDKMRMEPAWVYWYGRALQQQGRNEEALVQFQSITAQTNFYGQLAQEELGGMITVPPRPQPPAAEEIAAMAQNQGFRRALRFFDLNLRAEGYREWNWELRKMSERQLFAAAEYARQNNVLDRMISTSDRTRIEMDFSQRFPAPYEDLMHPAAQTLGLDEAWIYGLIRQESRFVRSAKSYVGAQGLMQVMPSTAKYIARRIGLDGYTPAQASEIGTNITLGTNYLAIIYNNLDNSQVLATAAYNAGPGRPATWRSSLSMPVEGAVFAESIPFNETRDYVKNVLSNATYYAAMFEDKPQSLKARLGMVQPKGYTPSDIP